MRNRTKKDQKLVDQLNGFILLVVGLIGWFLTESLKCVGIAVVIGIVLIMIYSTWRGARLKKRMKESNIEEIDRMSGTQFEEYVGTLFDSLGYNVSYTQATGDYGADLILKRGKEVVTVQAKRYKSSVGVKAVQEVIPSVKMYHANAACVITNSMFTKQALKLAKRNGVRMIDRHELMRMSREMRNEKVVGD